MPSGKRRTVGVLVWSVLTLLLLSRGALAAPSGGTVVSGGAVIQQAGTTTTITQATNQAIINWQSFSIGANELVKFIQPNQLAVALNRVTGIDPSVLLGSLQANGRIFLVNPNGILFGAGATVDVGGIMASTLSIKDSDFLGGNYVFQQNPGQTLSAIVNQGSIKASDGGYVVLVAPLVNNQGNILADANIGAVETACGTPGSLSGVWQPDLRKSQWENTISIMVKF